MNEPIKPLAFSPPDAAVRLGISLRGIYLLIATGDLRSAKIGKRRLIPDTELQDYLKRKLKEN